MTQWTFLTNHTHVLLCIARDPGLRLSEIARLVGITERAAQRIVNELSDAGYLTRTRVGRRNTYTIVGSLPLRHPLEQHQTVAALLTLIEGPAVSAAPADGTGPT